MSKVSNRKPGGGGSFADRFSNKISVTKKDGSTTKLDSPRQGGPPGKGSHGNNRSARGRAPSTAPRPLRSGCLSS